MLTYGGSYTRYYGIYIVDADSTGVTYMKGYKDNLMPEIKTLWAHNILLHERYTELREK